MIRYTARRHVATLLSLALIFILCGCEQIVSERITIEVPWVLHGDKTGNAYYCSDWSNIPIIVKPEPYAQRLSFRAWAARVQNDRSTKSYRFKVLCDDEELLTGVVTGRQAEEYSIEFDGLYASTGGQAFSVIIPPSKDKIVMKHTEGNCFGEFGISEVSIAPASEAAPADVAAKQPQQVTVVKPPAAAPPAAHIPAARPGPRPAAAGRGLRWAVVIGISEYADSRIPPLRYAAADAKGFYDWLVSPEGGRYAPNNVRLLLNRDATALNIKKALFNWLGQAIDEDVVTIYFAGHGSPASPDMPSNLFLLSYDCDYDTIASSAFPMWDIETALRRFIKAKKVIMIADACHSGGVGSGFAGVTRGVKVGQDVSSALGTLTNVTDGVAVLCASDDKQLSRESKDWGGGHGAFTYFLLMGLQGKADYNADGRVSLGELIPYLSEQVRRATRNTQSPTVAGRFDPALTIGR